MSEFYSVVATPGFKVTLKKLSTFLRRKYGVSTSEKALLSIKRQSAQLAENPLSAPVSERLLALGISDYRQLTVEQRNTVFYRVDKTARKIVLIAVMDSRQSIEKLLYETMISIE